MNDARTGLLLVNSNAGRSQREEPDAIAASLPSLELRVCEPADLSRQLVQAVAGGAPLVAVAGGDGTIRTAASVLSGTPTVLLVVPLGTFNHFSRSLGIESIEDAADALTNGTERRVDLGDVNGETFVNNASIGWYADMLETRGRFTRHMPRQLAKVAALIKHLPRAPRFDVELHGRAYTTWLVWVGNGSYELRPGHLAERVSLVDHELDVRILSAEHRWARLRAALALLGGEVERSDALLRFNAPEVTFRVGRSTVAVGVDGDGIGLPPPLHFRSVPDALTVLMAPAHDEAATTS